MKTLERCKIALGLVILLLANFNSHSQNTPATSCSSDHKNDSLIQHDPRFARSLFLLEQAFHQNMDLPPADRTDDVYTIPVVVHVIHEGEAYGQGSNITDEQIYSAITALNDDFRKVTGTNGFGAGVDVKIQFCLASRNPSGQPTTGINRVNGSSVPLYADQGIESSGNAGANEEAVKALSTWPRASYVNIWVVNEIENNDGGSGVQGYAYFPFNNPVDGIVVLHNAFGTVGNLKSYTNMNRTLTHEMGHFFGLYHTFHETTSCSSETNCTTAGDRVCDTPPTILNASCSAPACSGTQQVANYLDYTSQTCQDMFTEGQKTRMRTTLETQRTSLLTSLGCMPVYVRDAGITQVFAPAGTSCNTSYTPSVTLTNFGSAALTSVAIQYNIDGVGSSTYSWTGNLASGSSATVTLPTVIASLGSHTFYAWTNNPNGLADENASNNQSTSLFTVTTGATLELVVQIDYFGTETTWEVVDSNDNQIAFGGPYVNNQQGTTYNESLCLPNGCYTLIFHDAYGDGMAFTNGQFTLYGPEDEVLAHASGNWGATHSTDFCVTAAPAGSAPTATFTTNDNIICAGGSVNFTYTGQNNPTSYAWIFEGASTALSSVANPSNIAYQTPGTYDVTLTVSNEFGSANFVCANCITVSAAPTVTLTPTATTCSGTTNGSVTSLVSGANAPFSYAWNNGSTSANISNLAAGSYSVTVTDAQGCVRQQSTTVTSPAPISITGSAVATTCSGSNNGSITVSAAGGTGNKTYIWNNGMNGTTINGLAAGTYTVSVTDANGCNNFASFTVGAPTPLQVSVFHSDATCNGSQDGTAVASFTGGTGAVTFAWSTGNEGQFDTNLGAGTYIVTATDANGCTDSESFIIEEPQMLVANIIVLSPETCAGNDGSASIEVEGGNGNYIIVWGDGSNSAIAEGLSAGNYFVSVADNNGCTLNANVNIPYECDTPAPTTKLVDADCGATGLALTSVISCNPVESASMYQWKFTTATGQVLTEDFTLGTEYYLGQSNAIQNNMLILVSVKAMIAETWGPFGQVCTIQTEQTFGTTALSSDDCGSTISQWNTTVSANEVANAVMYEWTFTGLNEIIVLESDNNSLELTESSGLNNGESYLVKVRCLMSSNAYTPFGVECPIQINLTVGLNEVYGNSAMILYPNPNNGEKITLEFGNYTTAAAVKDIKIFGSTGSLIESKQALVQATGSNKLEYTFNHPLASGVYVVQYTLNGNLHEEKLIVR
jgi:PKD repeat protein